MNAVLEFVNLTKRFPGVIALDQVSFSVGEREILGLVGENGAGKSTLLKTLAGVYVDYEGEFKIDGNTVTFNHPKEALLAGVSVIYQELNFMNDLTVAENIFLGKWPKHRNMVNYKEMNARSAQALRELKVEIEPTALMSTLTVAQKQIVEIAKAITNETRILVMDEPTSALSEQESLSLIELVKHLRDTKGISIIYVSHKLDEIYALCDRVQVIRDGKTIAAYPVAEVSRDLLIKDMVGREVKDIYPKIETHPGDAIYEVEHVTGKFVKDISLKVHAGEIVSVYGLMGSGTVELADTLFGAKKIHSGSIRINGQEVTIKSPADSIANGVAYLTSDRKGNGLILIQSIAQNIATASLDQEANKIGVIDEKKEIANAEKWREKMQIKTPSVHQLVGNLSGGNQQKVVIGKWLSTNSKILIFCDPTRGIDVNAKYEIYKILKELCLEGYAVLMVSHEIPEILGISDRVYIIRDGMFSAEFAAHELNQDMMLEHAIGKEH